MQVRTRDYRLLNKAFLKKHFILTATVDQLLDNVDEVAQRDINDSFKLLKKNGLLNQWCIEPILKLKGKHIKSATHFAKCFIHLDRNNLLNENYDALVKFASQYCVNLRCALQRLDNCNQIIQPILNLLFECNPKETEDFAQCVSIIIRRSNIHDFYKFELFTIISRTLKTEHRYYLSNALSKMHQSGYLNIKNLLKLLSFPNLQPILTIFDWTDKISEQQFHALLNRDLRLFLDKIDDNIKHKEVTGFGAVIETLDISFNDLLNVSPQTQCIQPLRDMCVYAIINNPTLWQKGTVKNNQVFSLPRLIGPP